MTATERSTRYGRGRIDEAIDLLKHTNKGVPEIARLTDVPESSCYRYQKQYRKKRYTTAPRETRRHMMSQQTEATEETAVSIETPISIEEPIVVAPSDPVVSREEDLYSSQSLKEYDFTFLAEGTIEDVQLELEKKLQGLKMLGVEHVQVQISANKKE